MWRAFGHVQMVVVAVALWQCKVSKERKQVKVNVSTECFCFIPIHVRKKILKKWCEPQRKFLTGKINF